MNRIILKYFQFFACKAEDALLVLTHRKTARRRTLTNLKGDTMKTITTTIVYGFPEISKESQTNALDSLRDINVNHEWWEFVYDDVCMVAELLGIDIDKIYFSGFSSQGDGACFAGTYSYRKGWKRLLKQSVGGEDLSELLAIGEALQDAQKTNFYDLVATTSQTGYYMHSGCMQVSVDSESYRGFSREAHDIIVDTLRAFADWIYSKLEKEYRYLTSDSAVIESIGANECQFTKEGRLF